MLLSSAVFAQTGRGVYRFLELPVSSRTAAIGGQNISLRDNDINFALLNPALLTRDTHGTIGLNAASYLADIKFGSAVYGHNFGENNFFAVGVQYVDFGEFAGYNELGQYVEDFTAKDMALYINYARSLSDNLSLGAAMKPIVSAYESYTSVGLAFDLGLNYSTEFLSAGLVLKNAGAQLKGYYEDEKGQHREPLPFEIQLGMSKRFEHAPLRISITATNLQRWNLAGYDSNFDKQVGIDGITTQKQISFLDMAFRHLIFGVEFLPTENFYVAAGYNHRRNREMSIEHFKSMAGFSFGAGVKLYKFQVGFGMTQFMAKNNAFQFSISTNLNEFVSF